MYINYEVLCHAFDTKIIDFSKVEIYKLKSSEINKKEFEEFLIDQNQYSLANFNKRHTYISLAEDLEEILAEKRAEDSIESKVVELRQLKQHADLRPKKPEVSEHHEASEKAAVETQVRSEIAENEKQATKPNLKGSLHNAAIGKDPKGV